MSPKWEKVCNHLMSIVKPSSQADLNFSQHKDVTSLQAHTAPCCRVQCCIGYPFICVMHCCRGACLHVLFAGCFHILGLSHLWLMLVAWPLFTSPNPSLPLSIPKHELCSHSGLQFPCMQAAFFFLFFFNFCLWVPFALFVELELIASFTWSHSVTIWQAIKISFVTMRVRL